jgi:dTDP-4-dehydrorhamnose reductase
VTRVLVLGSTGMLGAMVVQVLGDTPGVELETTERGRFDAARDDPGALLAGAGPEWVVNAIGITAAHIDEDDPASVAAAHEVNAAFPARLAAAAAEHGARVIHLSTDGIFSGTAGPYAEDAAADADGVYAQTKRDGEVVAPHVLVLRCSIVGPESPGGTSLLAWVLAQPRGAMLYGYADHRWNGLTTLHFAGICAAIVRGGIELPSPLHVVPADVVSKARLLTLLAESFGRRDLEIRTVDAPAPIDRSLVTRHPAAVAELWRAAGHDEPPTVAAMVAELARSSMVRDRS